MSDEVVVINRGAVERVRVESPIGLERLQSLVGGYIEMIRSPKFTMWVNEEGWLRKDLEPNLLAVRLLEHYGVTGLALTGPAVVTFDNEEESFPLPDDLLAEIVGALTDLGAESA